MSQTALGVLGIMTGRGSGFPPITEQEFCRRLCATAPLYELQAFVFHPEGVADGGASVTGYILERGHWKPVTAPPPDILYNRCLYSGPPEKRMANGAMVALPRALPWSRGLPDKWGVYRILRRSRKAAPLLPETRLYTGPSSLSAMLAERKDGVFMKPSAGFHGKRSLHARRRSPEEGGGISVSGRDGGNRRFLRIFSFTGEALRWIHRFISRRRYIMQPYLHLTDSKGHPFDVRVLMQKNGKGIWDCTGMAVRLGGRGALTSNLHGGGTAAAPRPYLLEEYGKSGEGLLLELAAAAAVLPPLLEESCGRLGELGLDFGIDGGGRIYLLEANSKPGRAVFDLTGDRQAARLAAENPLRYARHLLLTYGAQRPTPADSSNTDGE